MKNPFHTFLIEILDQIDGDEADKEDMYEELLIHLQLTADDFKQKGYDNKQAVQMAKKLFGESEIIGTTMQEAMFPKRKILLLLLSLASMFYSIAVYLAHLVLEGNASIIWLFLSIGSSSILLLYALPILPALSRKKWLNTGLIIHIFMYLYGMLLATSLHDFFAISLTLFALVIMLYTMVMIYRTTIYDFQYSSLQNIRPAKQLHFLNITIGMNFIIHSPYRA